MAIKIILISNVGKITKLSEAKKNLFLTFFQWKQIMKTKLLNFLVWDHTISSRVSIELHDFACGSRKSSVFTREKLTRVLIFHTIFRVMWKHLLKAEKKKIQ